MIHEHEFGDLPDDAAGSSPSPFGGRRSTHSSSEGADPAPPFPSRNARNGRTRRWPSHRSPLSSPDGRQFAGVHLHLVALTKRGAAATVAGEARERTLRQRARPPRRDGGKGRAWRRLASPAPAPAPVGVPPHSLAAAVAPLASGAEMNERWRERSEGLG
jgi:hypothetical protein